MVDQAEEEEEEEEVHLLEVAVVEVEKDHQRVVERIICCCCVRNCLISAYSGVSALESFLHSFSLSSLLFFFSSVQCLSVVHIGMLTRDDISTSMG